MFYIKHKIRHDLHSHPGNGQLEKPVSLTYDPKGNILILDNERIQVSISPKQVFCLKITQLDFQVFLFNLGYSWL